MQSTPVNHSTTSSARTRTDHRAFKRLPEVLAATTIAAVAGGRMIAPGEPPLRRRPMRQQRLSSRAVWAFAAVAISTGAATHAAVEDDAAAGAVYRERCANCHDGGEARAPDRASLKLLSPDRVRAALTSGSMVEQARGLAPHELDLLVAYLSSPVSQAVAATTTPHCAAAPPALDGAFTRAHWNGWGNGIEQRRFQRAEMARLSAAEVPQLKLKWAFGFPGVLRAYGQPAVLGGMLFVGTAAAKVYALDAKSGCIYWEFSAKAPVRTAISLGEGPRGFSVYFGDQRANAYALDAMSGQLVWTQHVDEHAAAVITGAPTLDNGVLYVPVASGEEATTMNSSTACCTFRGGVVALDAQSGKPLWKGYSISAVPAPTRKNDSGVQMFGPAGAAIWSSPTVDRSRKLVYATTGNSYADPPSDGGNAFVAFKLDTGERAWVYQATEGDAYTMACSRSAAGQGNCPQANGPDVDFGNSAILVNLPSGQRALIAGQKSGVVHALDPDRNGALLWRTTVGVGGKLGGVQWGCAADEQHVYVAVSDVRIAPVAPGTPGGQQTPWGVTLRVDPDAGGGLLALKLATGEVAWKTPHPGCKGVPGCSPAQSAAVTAIPGVVFSGGLDGHLRAYAAASGRIIWDVDTKGPHATVNGVPAQGGSLDGPGAVVVDGMLYVNSGYAIFGGTPGNVLLAFSVAGK
ncbi:MAG TPA: PQQ-binding-like beta-propeller repeat protein [Burkholderiaceae bacterium]|nr:PQQ-binding-like beta-propeller repeat protein [Burkholderiaceae bacterium]